MGKGNRIDKKQSEKGNGEMGNRYQHPGVEYGCGYTTI